MIKNSEFELSKQQRLSKLKQEKKIIEAGRHGAIGSPIMAIHDMRIEEIEKFLGLKK